MALRLRAVAIAACWLLAVCCGCAYAQGGSPTSAGRLRICVADFRPEKGTVLNDRELDYCKMLQRGVEDELVRWYEVEESTRYGTIAKELANLDSAQAATVLGEKAGVHQVVTGLVTKVGSTVMVQCHFVEVPRAGQTAGEAANKVVRSVAADHKIVQEDDWVQLLKVLQAKIEAVVTGAAVVPPPPPPPPPPLEKKVRVKVCKLSGMSAGPYCKDTEFRDFKEDEVPEQCGICKPKPVLTPDELRLRIAQALRALDEVNYGEAARIMDEVVQAAEKDGEAWYIRGVTRFFQNRYEEAEQCYLKAIELGYDRASVRDDLANTYLRLSENPANRAKYRQMALEQARKSLELAPGNPWAYNMIGCVTFMTAGKDKEKLRTAAESLKKAAELLSSDPQLLDNAANALAQLNQLDEAEKYARASLTAAEKSKEPYPDAYETLSKIYAVRGDKENSKKYHELYRKAKGM